MQWSFSTARLFMAGVALCSLVMSGCSNNSSTSGPTTQTETFTFKVGDYTTYQNVPLDERNMPSTTSIRSSRTILRSGVSIGGQSDAFLSVDSTFAPANLGGTRVDTTYYRVTGNREVFQYIGESFVRSLASGIPGTTITGFRPLWVKIAELNDTPGTADFTSEFTLNLTLPPPLATSFPMNVRYVGRNQGRTTSTIDGTSHSVHRQTQTTTVAFSLLGQNFTQTVPVEFDFGAVNGSPRTILRTQTNSSSVNILGMVTAIPGSRSTFTAFRAGQ